MKRIFIGILCVICGSLLLAGQGKLTLIRLKPGQVLHAHSDSAFSGVHDGKSAVESLIAGGWGRGGVSIGDEGRIEHHWRMTLKAFAAMRSRLVLINQVRLDIRQDGRLSGSVRTMKKDQG